MIPPRGSMRSTKREAMKHRAKKILATCLAGLALSACGQAQSPTLPAPEPPASASPEATVSPSDAGSYSSQEELYAEAQQTVTEWFVATTLALYSNGNEGIPDEVFTHTAGEFQDANVERFSEPADYDFTVDSVHSDKLAFYVTQDHQQDSAVVVFLCLPPNTLEGHYSDGFPLNWDSAQAFAYYMDYGPDHLVLISARSLEVESCDPE